MKVLSIKEPFATLIKDGVKIYETRSFKTKYRGELYIHASLKISDSFNSKEAFNYLKSEINPGHILCKCNLVDCIEMTDEFIKHIKENTNESIYGKYEIGRYAWKLELLEVLNSPISVKGKLGIWNYEDR